MDTSFGRLFGVGASFYRSDTKQTFHQFLIDHLIQVLSQRWYETESERAQAEWHPILRWLHGSEQYLDAATPKAIYGQIHSFHPDGNGQALLTLADDVYQLAHIMKTPDKPILKRLRDRRSFQGARYEIFAASVLARCGYEVDFIEEKTKKAPDILAVSSDGTWSVMAEAKSRHRSEIPTHIANPESAQELQADVRRLIREAMQQNPGNMPFLIFVDVNLPFSPNRPPAWEKEVRDFIHMDGSQRSGYDLLSGLIATNYSWHYEGAKPSSDAETLFIPNQAAKYPLSITFCDALARALQEYGAIPDDEVRKMQLNERFPDLPPLT